MKVFVIKVVIKFIVRGIVWFVDIIIFLFSIFFVILFNIRGMIIRKEKWVDFFWLIFKRIEVEIVVLEWEILGSMVIVCVILMIRVLI